MARPQHITDDSIIGALVAQPEATSAEVAEALGIGQSTAGKRLAALEADGGVRRIPGGREAGRRVPDRWSARSASGRNDTAAGGKSDGAPSRPPTAGSGARLGRGALGSLVRDYLAARPKESFGPAAVGKALGRSQGAVSNALAKMATDGEAVLVSDAPRRYRIAKSH